MNKANGRKLQILSPAHDESHQLDLLSLISEQALPDLVVKIKKPRASFSHGHTTHINSFHFHGSLDKNKNFVNYCIGKPNQFAIEAIKSFISSERNDFGIIYLKAASGLGKSHILQAAGNLMALNKKSFYLSSPLMMSPIIDTFNMLKFYDILLIDDIEEIEGNTELQKILCQLIDFAKAGKIKLIITGAKSPKDLSNCDERTKGKLSSSLIHHIYEMNSDLAYAIVESKGLALNLDLPENVKRLISGQHDFNVYGFESLLFKLKSALEIKGQKITMELVLEETKDKKIQYRNDEFNTLLDSVAVSFQVSRNELMSSVRKKEFALARHVAMYLLKEVKHLSVMKIAEFFEKDHSSVIHGIARIKKQIQLDMKMKNKINVLITKNTF